MSCRGAMSSRANAMPLYSGAGDLHSRRAFFFIAAVMASLARTSLLLTANSVCIAIQCSYSKTCSAVLAACNNLKIGSAIDIVLSDSRLHNVIVSSLDRKIWILALVIVTVVV